MESNTFKTRGDGTPVAAVVAGMTAMVAAFVVDPFGRPVVMLSWGLFLGGLMLATVPGSTRRFGLGLALAGAIPPLALFLCAWVILSVGVLGGTVR